MINKKKNKRTNTPNVMAIYMLVHSLFFVLAVRDYSVLKRVELTEIMYNPDIIIECAICGWGLMMLISWGTVISLILMAGIFILLIKILILVEEKLWKKNLKKNEEEDLQ